jgi:hypothetical protein
MNPKVCALIELLNELMDDTSVLVNYDHDATQINLYVPGGKVALNLEDERQNRLDKADRRWRFETVRPGEM